MFKMSLKPMFNSVAKRYDLLNRLLTWTLDETWREICAQQCASHGIIVDLCCGTGNLTSHILKHTAPETIVVGLDFSKAMLARAVNKNHTEPKASYLSFILADAAHLPFKEGSIDCIGISFSFRNLVYKNPQAKASLKEAVRSLRFDGKFVCVETSQPTRRLLKTLYRLYLMKIVPIAGWLVSGRKNAYRYLGMSAANFPSAEEIVIMLKSVGFRKVSFKPLTFGVVALHMGAKNSLSVS